MIALDVGGTKTTVYPKIQLDLEKVEETDEYICYKTDFKKIYEKVKDKRPLLIAWPGTYRRIEKGKYYVFSMKPIFEGIIEADLVVNDVKAFSFYHACKFYSNKENRNKTLLVIEIGTGVNGVFYTYDLFKNPEYVLERLIEMGHIVFNVDGEEECPFGHKGCAEAYISGKFLEKLASKYGLKIADIFRTNLCEIYYKNLAKYLASLIHILNPDKIVLGGTAIKEIELEKLKERIKENLMKGFEVPEIEISLNRMDNIYGLIKIYEEFKLWNTYTK